MNHSCSLFEGQKDSKHIEMSVSEAIRLKDAFAMKSRDLEISSNWKQFVLMKLSSLDERRADTKKDERR